MAKRKQRRGKQKMPPLSTADFIRVLKAAGWKHARGTKHLAFEHPTTPGKVNVSAKWEHIKLGDWAFRSVLEQSGMTRAEFEKLYWETR